MIFFIINYPPIEIIVDFANRKIIIILIKKLVNKMFVLCFKNCYNCTVFTVAFVCFSNDFRSIFAFWSITE